MVVAGDGPQPALAAAGPDELGAAGCPRDESEGGAPTCLGRCDAAIGASGARGNPGCGRPEGVVTSKHKREG